MKCDLHIHSKYSFDSIMEPRNIMKLCRKIGYSEICIADHNSLRGSLEAKKYEKEFGVRVICGEERLTDAGDIIGLNLTEDIKKKIWVDVLEEIRNQNGLSILVHPFRGHQHIEQLASNVDLIETWNSHSKPTQNAKAVDLAMEFRKPPVAGSDAHLYSEIGNVAIDSNDILDFKKEFTVKYCRTYERGMSYVVGLLKSHIPRRNCIRTSLNI